MQLVVVKWNRTLDYLEIYCFKNDFYKSSVRNRAFRNMAYIYMWLIFFIIK